MNCDTHFQVRKNRPGVSSRWLGMAYYIPALTGSDFCLRGCKDVSSPGFELLKPLASK